MSKRFLLLTTTITWGPLETKVGESNVIVTRLKDHWHALSLDGTVGLFGLTMDLKRQRTFDEFAQGKKLQVKLSRQAPALISIDTVSLLNDDHALASMSMNMEGGVIEKVPLDVTKKGDDINIALRDKHHVHQLHLHLAGLSVSGLHVKHYRFL